MAAVPREPLRVVFSPTWPKNPYHAQLISHLAKLDVEVLPDASLKGILREKARGKRVADLVHLHAVPRFQCAPGMWMRLALHLRRISRLRRSGVGIVLTVHDLFPHETMSPAADRLIGRAIGRCMDGLFVHSLSAKLKLSETWNLNEDLRVRITPHPHFIDCYPNTISRSEARSRLAVGENEIVFLFLGMIRPYKGVDELVEGFSKLENKRFKLLIVGEPLNEALGCHLARRCQGDSRIKLQMEFVSTDDVQTYMNACDVVVLPYRRAFTSGAAVLAMSFAKPCVATKVDSFPEVLDDKGAFFCEVMNSQDIARSLQTAAAALPVLQEMGRYNFDRASRWRWEDMATSLAGHYARIKDDASVWPRIGPIAAGR